MKVLKIVWLVIFIGLGCLPSVYGATEAEKHFRQVYEYYSQGKYEQAIDEYQKVIEIDPKGSEAYLYRGNAKYKIGDKKGACKDYKSISLGDINDEDWEDLDENAPWEKDSADQWIRKHC